jgi:phospholipid/cholesterol/gamma-HCH transport system ATP-binding protein
MKNNEPVIVVEQLCKAFGDNVVLDHFDLTLNRGENLVVLGKSGSGKSVLIKCIIGLLRPDSGRIEVLGQNVPELSYIELDQLRARVGFLFQSNALYDSMTVRENLEFPLRRHWLNVEQKDVDNLVLEVLESVGLEHTVDMMPAELSGGMRKRIALARTLILKPDIILYDEPTTGLDAITGMEIIELIKQLQEKYQTSALVISHDMKLARYAAKRIAMLIDGKCYATGTYQELSTSKDPTIRAFFD